LAGRRAVGLLLLLRLLGGLLVRLQLLLVGLDLVLVGRNGRLVARFLVGLTLLLVLLQLVLVRLHLILRGGARRAVRRGAGLREGRATEGEERCESNSFQFHYWSP